MAGSAAMSVEGQGWIGTKRLTALWAYLDSDVSVVPFGALAKARRRVRVPRLLVGEPNEPQRIAEARREAVHLEVRLRQLFVKQNGVIVNEYYCPYAIGGAALTEAAEDRASKRGFPLRIIHSVLNTSEDGLLSLESECHLLFEDVVTVFGERKARSPQLRTATDAVFGARASVLLAADTAEEADAGDADADAALRAARFQVQQTSARLMVGVQRQARFTYFVGVLVGAVATLILSCLLGVVCARYWSPIVDPRGFVAATTFGTLGAVASVFQRMSSGNLVLDYTAPLAQRYVLGGLRPIIGAVLALVVHFALISGLFTGQNASAGTTPVFGFSVVVGFVSGFSERFATDMIERAGRVLAQTREEDKLVGSAGSVSSTGASRRGSPRKRPQEGAGGASGAVAFVEATTATLAKRGQVSDEASAETSSPGKDSRILL